jgi:uncharacterized protein (DUF1015 family)
MGPHTQTGLVCIASVADYDTNRIRKHEFTQPKKEDDRVRQITALNAQTGPVLLAYRSVDEVREIFDTVASGDPIYDLIADDGVEHALWIIDEQPAIEQLTATFDAMDALYIADGHHRSASASRVAATSKAANPNHTGDEDYNYFLCVAFPHDETRILDYNRVVRDLNGLEPDELIAKVAEKFSLEPVDGRVRPEQSNEFGMYLNGQWYRLRIRRNLIPTDDPVASLDVSLLQDYLIGPILGIQDQRTDSRIDFVGGIRGLKELERRVDNGEMKVAFAFYPTSMEALMAVADANQVMPTKSTWFEPKLADGLISHVIA